MAILPLPASDSELLEPTVLASVALRNKFVEHAGHNYSSYYNKIQNLKNAYLNKTP